MSGIAANRLLAERAQWRKDHPFGFYAKPIKKTDDSLDLFHWQCGIPGKEGTAWAGSIYPVTMKFTEDYPTKPPKCAFPEGFYHPNVFPSGTVCLSILSEDQDWKPSMGIRQVRVWFIFFFHKLSPTRRKNET
jgi:ubiquitin-conjugating enzyme E2 I